MYFVPVRKLLKIFFVRFSSKRERKPLSLHQNLDSSPDSRQSWCYRRLLSLIIVILVCFYIVFCHRSSKNIYFLKQLVSVNMTDENPKERHTVKKSSPQLDAGNRQLDDFPKNVDENITIHNNERNITMIVTANKPMVIYKDTDKAENNGDAILVSTKSNEKDEPILLTVSNNELPVCGSMAEQNEKFKAIEERSKIKRRLTDSLFSEVKMGGYYHPKNCRSRHKVAILVPYRNRERNLAVFTYHMHPFLIKQQLEYRIFIIEQDGKELFNRGKLFNIGFMEMMKYNEWHCVVLHDVDLLPQSDKILYTCPTFPRHMCGTVVQKAKLTYNQYHTLFGGVSAMSVKHYKQINGFSNLYWGWGGEDNDMYWRILLSRIPIVRYNKTITLYKSLPHTHQPKNTHRYQLLKFTMARYLTDGLSSLVYKVLWTKHRHLYTHILADVNPMKENITDVYNNLFRN